MEKSNAHWKAAHPFLFISTSFILGILIGNHFFKAVNTPIFSIAIIASGSLLLLGIRLLPIPFLLKGFFFYCILISWGIAIHMATQEKNLIQIPYPKSWVDFWRNWVVQKINTNIVDKEDNGFSLALLLGVKSDLNKSVLQAYTQLGIIHIVAISGMHLEIIFKNLTRITNFLPRRKFYLGLELFIVLSGVWLYTFMANASPSIVRASVFFSIYFIGKYLQQSIVTLNTIATGMLILLLFDVKNIDNIGLQLSYAAVLGIHLFYPLFFKMLPMDNPLLIFLWSNLCVSFSAQLITFPILVFHFHQMATMVIISNFIMVPLSNILLYSLVVLVACPPIFQLPHILGQWIQYYVLWINASIRFIDAQPISGSIPLHMDKIQTVSYYIALWLLYRWLLKKKAFYLVYLLGLMVIYALLKLFSLL